MSDYFSSVMAQAGSGATVASQDGSITYVFGNDGVASVEAEKFKLTLNVDVQGVALDIVVSVDGRATASYTLSDPNKVTFSKPQMGDLKFSATLNGTELFSSTPRFTYEAACKFANELRELAEARNAEVKRQYELEQEQRRAVRDEIRTLLREWLTHEEMDDVAVGYGQVHMPPEHMLHIMRELSKATTASQAVAVNA